MKTFEDTKQFSKQYFDRKTMWNSVQFHLYCISYIVLYVYLYVALRESLSRRGSNCGIYLNRAFKIINSIARSYVRGIFRFLKMYYVQTYGIFSVTAFQVSEKEYDGRQHIIYFFNSLNVPIRVNTFFLHIHIWIFLVLLR